jgi:hypothetical protein
MESLALTSFFLAVPTARLSMDILTQPETFHYIFPRARRAYSTNKCYFQTDSVGGVNSSEPLQWRATAVSLARFLGGAKRERTATEAKQPSTTTAPRTTYE